MKSLKKIFLVVRNILGWWIVGAITLIIILSGYGVSWTGFGDYTTPAGEFVREKTFWDWMELLIIPGFLWAGAVAVNRSEKQLEQKRSEERAKLEHKLELDRQQESALQAYIDRISELLLKEKLRTTKKAEVRDVARTRTISILRVLDTRRSNLVLQFLREANLITDEKSILSAAKLIGMDMQHLFLGGAYLTKASLRETNLELASLEKANLQGADLTLAKLTDAYLPEAILKDANLMFANLERANLLHANLARAILQGANLQGADMQSVDMQGAFLVDANLANAKLKDADLRGTNFDGAILNSADMRGANLSGAKNITEEQLATVKSLKGATMPEWIERK